MVDFEWYRSFISIYKHHSVSEAAKARIMTQPAMSQHLAALEAEVGEPLFTRAPRKMIPTEKGKELYTKIVPLIENLEGITLDLKLTTSLQSMSIVRIGSPFEYFTDQALRKICQTEFRYFSQFGIAPILLEWLQEDKVDIIITTQKYKAPGIEYINLEEEEFVLVAHPSFEVSFQPISLEEWLSKQKWISYGLELPIIRRFWREHFKKRPEIQPFHIIPDLRAILKAIENNMGISMLPTYLVQESVKNNDTKIIFPDKSVKNDIYIAYALKNKDHPIIMQAVNNLIG
ncbi:LysR family transcriptional regulator [Bacillus sp. 03113]|uniref:LysR family transcriptional regulator n=1 Tax=Bacillus sp. 03113 TaxID=2578211 RepID=UPI001141530D|nr:LysR family transcriptional regulator [Bacillus sp. 03113]